MGTFRGTADRRQSQLFPPSLEDYVSSDDWVRSLDALVDELDLSSIESAYSSFGRPAYAPRILVKVLLYGKTRGIRSSRELARSLCENVRFMWLSSHETPDFRTLSDFRKRFHRDLAGLLKQTIGLGVRAGLIDLKHVTVDGTTIGASAGRRSFRSPGHLAKDLKRLEQDLERSFQEDIAQDEREDEQHGDHDGEPRLPAELSDRKRLVEKIRQALKHYEALDTSEKGKLPKQVSLTDPESRFMKSNGLNRPSYNGQVAVDVSSRMIVGGYATNAVSDNGELPGVLAEIESNTGQNPDQLTADRGYSLKEGLSDLTRRGIDGYIPQRIENPNYFSLGDFQYDQRRDLYRCPNGQKLHFKCHRGAKRKRYKVYECRTCSGCALAAQCIRQGGMQMRTLHISIHNALYEEMREKMRTAHARLMLRIRASTVEPTFGHLKMNRKLREFAFRGLAMINSMWKFELAALNLEKLIRAQHVPRPTAV